MDIGRTLYHLDDLVARAHPLNRGRVAWWRVLPPRDGGARWYDLVGLNHGTLVGGPAWQGTARPGGSGHLLFDGVDDQVAVSVVPGNVHTIAVWARLDAASSYPSVFSGALSRMELRYSGSTRQPEYLVDAVNGIISPAAMDLGSWNRILVTSDGSTTSMYVNGVLAAAGATGDGGGQPLTSIGAREAGGQPFPGAIDDVTAWSRVLSAAEIAADYDLSRSGYAIP